MLASFKTALFGLTLLLDAANGKPVSVRAPRLGASLPALFRRADVNPTSYNMSLPNVTIYATGGTIAGSAGTADQTTGYQAGALGVEVLIDAVPELVNVSNVAGIQVTNTASDEITPAILLNMTKQIGADLMSPLQQGAVITHGTDTLEETAFFLDLTLNTTKPVVIVGAMRPATAISADGPANLLEAVTLAGDPGAAGRGTMVVLNDRITSAFFATKIDANTLDTFKALEQGHLGVFIDLLPHFYYSPATPLGKPFFDVSALPELPRVDILYSYQGFTGDAIPAAVAAGAKGIVIAGAGAGATPSWVAPYIQGAINASVPVVISTRTPSGSSEGPQDPGIASGWLNPPHSRILLQLAIAQGLDYWGCKALFETRFGTEAWAPSV